MRTKTKLITVGTISFFASSILLFTFSQFFPYWYDEHVFYRFGWEYNFIEGKNFFDVIRYCKQAYHPPLHLLLHIFTAKALYPLQFYSYDSLRYISIFLSSSAIGLLCVDAFRNKKMPFFTFILLLYPNVIFSYFWQVGPYALSFFLSTVYFLRVKEMIRKNDSSFDWIILVSATALSYTHYFGTLMVLVVGLVALIRTFVHKERCFKNLLIIHLASFILFFPWLLTIWSRILAGESMGSIGHFIPDTVGSQKFHFYATYVNDHVRSLMVVFTLFVLSFLKNFRSVERRRENWWILSFVALWGLIEWKAQVSTPLYRSQYTIIFFPLFVWLFSEQVLNIFKTQYMRYLFSILFIFQQAKHAMPQFMFNKENYLFGFYEKSTQLILSDIKLIDANSNPTVYHKGNSTIELKPYGIKNAVMWDADSCKSSSQIAKKNDYLLFPHQGCSKEILTTYFSDWDILIDLPGTLLMRKK
jgi:hypothetical protein